MADEKNERESLAWDIEWEKKEKKIMLICTAVGAGLGLIIGIVVGVQESGVAMMALMGLWIGSGIGCALSYIPNIPYAFKETMKREGFGEAVKTTFFGILVWLLIFWIIGPVGLLIRLLIRNHKIKKLEKRLSELGQ